MTPEVLIIDQKGLLRQRLAGRLQQEGCQVFEAEGGGEAEEIASGRDIDVILLDLGPQKREAFGLLQQIKHVWPVAEIILLNSGEDIHLSIEGMKLGAFDDIFPPFDLAVITSRVKAAWEKKEKAIKLEEKVRPLPRAINQFASTVGLNHVRLWYGLVLDQFMEFELGSS